jgi:hypothetical protein
MSFDADSMEHVTKQRTINK